MPIIPTLDSPNVEPHPIATPYGEDAPQGAFGGRFAQGLASLGGDVGQVAKDAREQASTVASLNAESAYQGMLGTVVYNTDPKNPGFAGLFGEEALSKSEEVRKLIEDKRNEFANTLPDLHAQQTFLNNSQRLWRLAQADIDKHTSQQRRIQIGASEKGALEGKIADAAIYGKTPMFDVAGGHARLDSIARQAQQAAQRKGLDENGIEGEVRVAVQRGADAMLNGLARDNPKVFAEVYREFEPLLGAFKENNQKTYEHVVTTQAADSRAADIVKGLIDPTNPTGSYLNDKINEARASLNPNDALDAATLKNLNRAVLARGKEVRANVNDARQSIMEDQSKDVPFSLSVASAPDVATIKLNDPVLYRALQDKESRELRAQQGHTTHDEKKAQDSNYGSLLLRLDNLPSSALMGMKPGDVAEQALAMGHGMTDMQVDQLQRHLLQRQKEETHTEKSDNKPLINRTMLNQAVSLEVAAKVKGKNDRPEARQELHRAAVEFIAANPKATEDDLSKLLKSKTEIVSTGSGFFDGSASRYKLDIAARTAGGVPGPTPRPSAPVQKAAAAAPEADFDYDPVAKKLVPRKK